MNERVVAPAAQRIDRWLWCARLFRTRTLAAKFVESTSVRVARGSGTVRAEKPSFSIRAGDTLVFNLHERLRIIDVVNCALRRGPAREATELYVDRSPPKPRKEDVAPEPFMREPGSGRPTKKDRRALQAIKPAANN